MGALPPPDDLPRSPSGRVPQWVLDEAAGRPVEPVPFRGATNLLLTAPSTAKARRGAGRRRAAITVAVVVAVLGGVLWSLSQPRSALPTAAPTTRVDGPPAGLEESDRPADLPVVGAVGPSRSFRFLAHQQDGVTPVTWSPCRPVHWVVRQAGAPAGGQQLLEKAFARVSAATGIDFVADGTTDEGWSEERELYQPDRYGERWAPVLVVWATSSEVPDFGVDIAGEAGPAGWRTPAGDTVFVSGAVALSVSDFRRMASSTKQRAMAEAIVLHELGHLLGLAHVDDKKQLMFPRAQNGLSAYGAGDLAGLTALGRGPCRPEI